MLDLISQKLKRFQLLFLRPVLLVRWLYNLSFNWNDFTFILLKIFILVLEQFYIRISNFVAALKIQFSRQRILNFWVILAFTILKSFINVWQLVAALASTLCFLVVVLRVNILINSAHSSRTFVIWHLLIQDSRIFKNIQERVLRLTRRTSLHILQFLLEVQSIFQVVAP